jgi:hypothetical protein
MDEFAADRSAIPGPSARFPRSSPQHRPRRRSLPLYRVILQYHAANDLMVIVWSVMELTRLCRTEAMYKMWQAYLFGRSILLTTYRERAELYVEQFADKGLTVMIEPA